MAYVLDTSSPSEKCAAENELSNKTQMVGIEMLVAKCHMHKIATFGSCVMCARSLQMISFSVMCSFIGTSRKCHFSRIDFFAISLEYSRVELLGNSSTRHLKVQSNYLAGDQYSIKIWNSNIRTPPIYFVVVAATYIGYVYCYYFRS